MELFASSSESEEEVGTPFEVEENPGEDISQSGDIGHSGAVGSLLAGRTHDHRDGDILRPEPVPVEGFASDCEDARTVVPTPEAWLVRHQAEDGSWDGATLSGRCTGEGCTGPGEAGHAVGDTGLALLVFFGTGETHKTPRYGKIVRSGLKHLKSVQDVEGCFGERVAEGWLEDHALATLAMAEAYGLTQSPLFKATAQNGVNFLQSCRDPYLAWRYGPGSGPRDFGTTAWAVMALKSAKGAGLEMSAEGIEDGMRWFEDRTDPVTGRVWAEEPGEAGERTADAPTAMGMLVRIFAGVPVEDPRVSAGARGLVDGIRETPDADAWRDPLFDCFATLAMFQVGKSGYARWRGTVVASLLEGFLGEEAGCAAGSSAPPEAGPGAGRGRLRTTALDTMTCAVIYRYRRQFGVDEGD